MKNEIILYRPDELAEHIEVKKEDETVWLNHYQISGLFDRDVKTIGKHINNVFAEGELKAKEGSRIVEKQVEYYNIDMIMAVE